MAYQKNWLEYADYNMAQFRTNQKKKAAPRTKETSAQKKKKAPGKKKEASTQKKEDQPEEKGGETRTK